MDLIDNIKTTLSGMGATQHDIVSALKGQTEKEQLKSFSLYLAAIAGDNNKVSKTRGLLVNGNSAEILKSLKSSSKIISKAIQNNHAKEPKSI